MLNQLGLLIALFAGPALFGWLILLAGYYGAQRKWAIYSCAATAAVSLLLQAVILYFVSDMGRSWGGSGDRLLVAGGALVTLLGLGAVPFFVIYKLDPATPAVQGASLEQPVELEHK